MCLSAYNFSSYYGLKDTDGADGFEAGKERHSERFALDGKERPDGSLNGHRQHGFPTVARFALCLNGSGRADFLLRRLPL